MVQVLKAADASFLQRTLSLAQMGTAAVFPNPQVGAVIVHEGRIIGEGYHAYAGGPHAEVVAIRSVAEPERLRQATMYVSLEPCSFHGKTPPCANLIVSRGIPRVVVGCEDPNPRVSGRGIALMRAAGIEVVLAPDPTPFRALNRAFFINQQQNRPYVTLKWAETADGFMARYDATGQPQPLRITGPEANAFTHSLRARHHAIAVGRRTAAIDNPRLDTRYFPGRSPLRLVFDRDLRLPAGLHLLQDGAPTLILNRHRSGTEGAIRYYQPRQWQDLSTLMTEIYRECGICSLMVEGGADLLQGFLDQGVYDEVHLLQGAIRLGQGLPGPRLPRALLLSQQEVLGPDRHLIWVERG